MANFFVVIAVVTFLFLIFLILNPLTFCVPPFRLFRFVFDKSPHRIPYNIHSSIASFYPSANRLIISSITRKIEVIDWEIGLKIARDDCVFLDLVSWCYFGCINRHLNYNTILEALDLFFKGRVLDRIVIVDKKNQRLHQHEMLAMLVASVDNPLIVLNHRTSTCNCDLTTIVTRPPNNSCLTLIVTSYSKGKLPPMLNKGYFPVFIRFSRRHVFKNLIKTEPSFIFGSGPRRCPGDVLGLRLMHLAVSRFVNPHTNPFG